MSESKERRYITERTKMWRTRDVKPAVLETLDTIEENGCEVMHVLADEVCPSFSYTAGVFDTSGKPELITVGLPSRTAHYAFEEAIKLMKNGVDLTIGRHRELINNVEVEFQRVDPKWLHQVMLRADWYYDEEDVPVLQLILMIIHLAQAKIKRYSGGHEEERDVDGAGVSFAVWRGVAVRGAVVAAALAGGVSMSPLRGREPGLYRVAAGA